MIVDYCKTISQQVTKYLNGKNKYFNIVVCAICEKKLKYLDKDGKRD
jgi:hypothetical protein